MGASPAISLSKKLRQVSDALRGLGNIYLATVPWMICNPSFNSSPWMRGLNHELRDLMKPIQTLSANANRAETLADVIGPWRPA